MIRKPIAAERRRTFAQILEITRDEAARTAWRRAELASRVRHVAAAAHDCRAAQAAARIKQLAILHTRRLLPTRVEIMPDDRFDQETFRIVLRGSGALHLPHRLLEGA
jgi:hypothetical protein